MVAIAVTVHTVIRKRYRTEVRPSIVTVLTSKSEATLIKSLNVTWPLGGRRLQVAIASTQRTLPARGALFSSDESCQRRSSAACHASQRADRSPTEMSEEEGSEIDGPARAWPSQ